MITGNKGEWSEPYVLFKLIADKKLFIGKENFQKVDDIFYPILKIIHHEKTNNTEFTFDGNIILINSNELSISLPTTKFIELSKLCLESIKKNKSKKGAFSIIEVEDFLNEIDIKSIKAKSGIKNDITIQVQDAKTFLSPTLGFSVKSQLGGPSTLVNASGATNFTYRLSKKLTQIEIEKIKAKRNFSDKFVLLKKFGVDLEFEKVDNPIFNINLQTIDYNFNKLLSDILVFYYKNDNPKLNSINNFVNELTSLNDLGYNLSLNPEIYQMMMKRFLVDYALGMRASEVWKRDYQANGGYLVVREDGEILCYHFYFMKNFENYLFENTRLETPSASRYKMAEIYEEDSFQKMKLNLQIRFTK